MSEHKHNGTRYWRRIEPDTKLVYFTTQSNAAHAKAEADSRATEIPQEEYEANVPVEAREQPYDATNGAAAPKAPVSHGREVPEPPLSPEQIIGQHQHQTMLNMLTLHREISAMLAGAPITHAERVFILEAIKHEFISNLMQPVPVAGRPS